MISAYLDALLINGFVPQTQYHFEDPAFKPREGTNVDAQNIKETFESINFRVDLHQDLRKRDIVRVIGHICDTTEDLSCVALIILSHGDERGYVEAFDGPYSLKSVVLEPLSRCKNIEGKAKMVFVQACR